MQQTYDGDRLRVKKEENGGPPTYYLRSTVLGGQIVAELNSAGAMTRGFVYRGGELLAVQQNNQVSWVHQDPVAKSKRVTDSSGNVVSTVELDPWGGDTARSSNSGFQPRMFTTYDRDGNASDEAMHRRYNRWHARFDQSDPYDGSYDLTNPQSFNRYSYVQNDPVNFVDPLGLDHDTLGPPPPVPTLIPYGGTIVTNTSAPRPTGGGGGGSILGGDEMFVPEQGPEENPGGDVGGPNPGPDPQNPSQNPTPDKLTSNQDVLDDLYCLWKRGGYGFQPTERAEWITQNVGKYGSTPWPWSATVAEKSWKGPPPAGTIAQAHTHPEITSQTSRTGAKPSTAGGNTGRGDQGTADKIGLPVYVLTRNAIWKAVPNAKNPVQVAGKDWWKPSEKAKVKCK